MVSAKEYFQRNREELNDENYDKKIKEHRRKKVIIFSSIIAGILLGIITFFIYNTNRTFHSYNILEEIKRDDDASTVFKAYDNKILKYNMDGISCISTDNKLVWNQSFEMKNPVVDICEKYIAVCDEMGNKIYIFNENGIQGEVETKLPIKKMCVAGQGTVAVLMEESDINYIDYYDKKGNLISENKAPVEKIGFPIDMSLSNDGYKLAVSYMMIENATIQTKLAFYNFDTVGENEIDHLVSAANYENEIIPQVQFLNKDVAVVFGTKFWEIYEGTQKPKSIFKQEVDSEIKSVFYNDKYIGLILKSEAVDAPYTMKIYNLKGKIILDKSFNFEYSSVDIIGSQIFLQNDAGCQIYNINGRLLYEGSCEEELQYVIPIDKTKINLVFPERILYVKLK